MVVVYHCHYSQQYFLFFVLPLNSSYIIYIPVVIIIDSLFFILVAHCIYKYYKRSTINTTPHTKVLYLKETKTKLQQRKVCNLQCHMFCHCHFELLLLIFQPSPSKFSSKWLCIIVIIILNNISFSSFSL